MRRTTAFLTLSLAAVFAGKPAAAQSVKVAPGTVHPSQALTASGTGFTAGEAIDVYIDTVDTALVVSNSDGTFSRAVTIPASATPGAHSITAIGRRVGDAAQAALTVTTPWAEAGFGAANRGWNPYENTISASNVGTLGLAWTAATTSIGASPCVVNGIVYVSTLYGIEAFRTSTGAALWTRLPGSSFYATPAIASGVIYIGSTQGTMYALSAVSGAVKWSVAGFGNAFSTVTMVNGIVYAGNDNGTVYAFAASNGALKWSFAADTGTFGSNGIQDTVAVVDGVVYAPSYNGYVYALNAATGALQWKYQTGSPISLSLAAVNGVVYVGNSLGAYAINAKLADAGTLLWSFSNDGFISTPAVDNGMVFIGGENSALYALDAYTGQEVWQAPMSGETYDITVANGVVYAGDSSGALHAFNETYGTRLWSAVLGSPVAARAVISDGVLYVNVLDVVLVDQAETYAFSLQAGNNVVRRPLRAPAPSSLRPDYSLKLQR